VYAEDSASLGITVVKGEHNLNQPVSNPSLTISQYRNMYYFSLLNGKFKIDASDPAGTGEMRYGGWTTKFRDADSTWVKGYYFYAYKNKGAGSGTTTYTLPNTNVYFIKGEQAGKYGIGSLFHATAGGYFETGSAGIVDAFTTSSGYGMTSKQLAVQWCDSGTCPL
jgi:hypothetical protein